MFWIFEKLRSATAWALFQLCAWILVPGVILRLCLFRVRLPDARPDGLGCLDECDYVRDTEDAVALQDEMPGVRR